MLMRLFSLTIASVFIFLLPLQMLAQTNAVISGKLTGDKNVGVSLTLSDPLNTSVQGIQQKSDINGNFTFTVNCDQLQVYRLSAVGNNYIILFVQPGETISLTLNPESLNANPLIAGSEITKLTYEIAGNVAVFDRKTDSLTTVFKQLQVQPDFESRKAEIEEQYNQVNEQKLSFLRDILSKNASSPATLLFIDKLDIDEDMTVYQMVADGVSSKYPGFKLARDLKQRVEVEKKLAVGMLAPEIELPGPDGTIFKLSELRGKVVLIDFWAAWCGPCRRENPAVVKMYNRFKDSGFDILGISLDRDRDAWLAAIEKDGLVWHQVSDLKFWQSEAAAAYGVKSIPHTVLIDRDGKIIARRLRGHELEKKLEEIFKTE